MHRLYSAGHARAQQGLLEGQEALRAYLTAYGPLGWTPAGRGIVFDFQLRPYEDEIVAELSRSLTSLKIGNIQFVAEVSIAEIAAALHEPWAASIAARWPQNLIAGIAGPGEDQQAVGGDTMITALRALHHGPSTARIPPAPAVSVEERDAARTALGQTRGAPPG